MQHPHELMKGLFAQSKLLILDFDQITPKTSTPENIQLFFEQSQKKGIDPKLPENRQDFNNRMIDATNARYVVSRYGEDRRAMLTGSSIWKQGRTIHLGVDTFSKNLETIYAPFDGEVICTGQEPEAHSFGYYLTFKPDVDMPYIFLGHLSSQPKKIGRVKAGDVIAELGDYVNGENGDWSRHLHLQLMTELLPNCAPPLGYATKETFAKLSVMHPDPMSYFPDWKIAS